MFYKVIKDNKVIDVLDGLVFLKYQEKHDRMQFCDKTEAQAIFSSDREHIWHEESLYNIPVSGYDTVRAEEIDEYEYRRLKTLNGNTPEWIIDRFLLSSINKEVSLLVESLKRLYMRQEIDASKVIELCNNFEITEEQMKEILVEMKEDE